MPLNSKVCLATVHRMSVLLLVLTSSIMATQLLSPLHLNMKEGKKPAEGKTTMRKSFLPPHQRTKFEDVNETPNPDDYYEDGEVTDGTEGFFPESPYEGIDYREELIKHHIVPDLFPMVPQYPLEVYYRHATVLYGNILTYNDTKFEPRIIKWHHEPNKHYTLLMTDPDGSFGDARSHEEEWHHWMITNIYGHHVGIGDPYAEYIGVIPSRGKHFHRYMFLIYEQPGDDAIDFDEIHLDSEPIDMLRGYFSSKQFANKYNLTGPIACNFFISDWSKSPPLPATTEHPLAWSTYDPEERPDHGCYI